MKAQTARRDATNGALLLILGCGAAISAIASSGCISQPSPDPEPPSGGQEFVLDYDVFANNIVPILTANGCDNTACHGGGIRGTFQLSPSSDKDIDVDFAPASLQVNAADPASSPLLMKPLAEAAGGDVHTADPQQFGFMSTSDPDYQAILAWIEAGEYR